MFDLEIYLKKLDFSEWEKDILIEFNETKPIDELVEYVKEENIHDFLINLADGIQIYKNEIK